MFKKTTITAIIILASTICFAEEPNLELKGEAQYTYSPKERPEDMLKNKLDYPATTIVAFVDSCATNMMQYMGMHPAQSRPIALKMCSCLIDQFRSDFKHSQFTKGGPKLAQQMAEEYGEVCKQLEFGRNFSM